MLNIILSVLMAVLSTILAIGHAMAEGYLSLVAMIVWSFAAVVWWINFIIRIQDHQRVKKSGGLFTTRK